MEPQADVTWHSWLQHCLCHVPHHLARSSPLPASTGTLRALHIAPKHYIFHAAQLQKEKQKVLDSIPGGSLASKVSCEMYADVALLGKLAPRKALQEQNQIKMSLDKPEATAQASKLRAGLGWRSSFPELGHWLQATCCSVFFLSLSTAPAALVFNPGVSLGMCWAMIWDKVVPSS